MGRHRVHLAAWLVSSCASAAKPSRAVSPKASDVRVAEQVAAGVNGAVAGAVHDQEAAVGLHSAGAGLDASIVSRCNDPHKPLAKF